MNKTMTLPEAQRHLKGKTEVVFDRHGRSIKWTVEDAHAARLVLYELARLQDLVIRRLGVVA